MLAELRAGALVAAPSCGQLADLGALLGRHGVECVAAGLAAGQDSGGVELAAGAAAGGFAAFAPHEIEGAWGHGPVRGHGPEGAPQSLVGPPELLAKPGDFRLHLCLYIYY